MTNTIITKSIDIHATVSQVWNALTKPELIKVYLFGTDTITDWKKGSPIFFRGEWEGKAYEDKGTILEIEEKKFLKYSYWSSFSNKADVPENYANVTYELIPKAELTTLVVAQDGLDSQERFDHSDALWGMVLENIKKLVEMDLVAR
jgi:Uncharacterized conserved protein